jgi:glutamyl-tRNA reductase
VGSTGQITQLPVFATDPSSDITRTWTWPSQKIGFVGIGIMGKGMVKNLATKVSSDLVIWNRSGDVCKEVRVRADSVGRPLPPTTPSLIH